VGAGQQPTFRLGAAFGVTPATRGLSQYVFLLLNLEACMQPRDFITALTVTAAFWSAVAQSQTYPSRPIVMVVPYAAGGTFDVMGRILAARMSELLNQPVIVENTTGAGGIIGVTRVINAPPDGYTVLLGSTGTHAYNQTIYKKRPYDAINDFTPVALFSEQPMVLEVRKDLPANTMPEFVALLKANAGKMQYTVPPAPARPRISPVRYLTPGSASTSHMCLTEARRRRRTI
jgi:hypothetical protein